jgi:hypothetical protein
MREVTLLVSDCISNEKAQYELDRVASNDWMSVWWHISDIQDIAGDCTPMSDDDARDILNQMQRGHNCEYGITWDVVGAYVDQWREQ